MLTTMYFSFPIAKIEAYAKWYRKYRYEQARMKADLRELQKLNQAAYHLKGNPFVVLARG